MQQAHPAGLEDFGEEQARTIAAVLTSDANLVHIRTFVIVARFLSFTAAARFLCLTPGAVSHRMAKLEDVLGFALFNRLTRGISLTPGGERLESVCLSAFQRFQEEVYSQLGHSSFCTLTLYSHQSIALAWLIPRLPTFHAAHPAVQLHVLTGNDPVSFTATTQVDVALHYANGVFPGLDSVKFMDEEVFPVCSPAYAQRLSLTANPQRLAACTLLSDKAAWHFSAPMAEWHEWCVHAGLPLGPDTATAFFDTSLAAATAACHHMGVAMGRRHIVQNMLDEGRLVLPFPALPALCNGFGYYAVWPRSAHPPAKVDALLHWLHEQAK